MKKKHFAAKFLPVNCLFGPGPGLLRGNFVIIKKKLGSIVLKIMIFFCFVTGFHLWATGEVKSLLLLQVNKTWNKWIERKIKWRKKREKMAKLTKAKVTGCLKSSALTLATLIGVIGGVIFGLCLRQRERKWWGTILLNLVSIRGHS